MSQPLFVADLGRMPFDRAWALQRELVDRVATGTMGDHLLFVEHDPVLTFGRKAAAEAEEYQQAGGIPAYSIERGGESTYHAPGQIVGYPILKLEGPERDLHRLLRRLEEVQIRAIARWGLKGTRKNGLTGVWVENRKIASIGIAVRRWVSYHGFGLNVNTDLQGFHAIRPCGMEAEVMTSMAALIGSDVPVSDVQAELRLQFSMVFDRMLFPSAEAWNDAGALTRFVQPRDPAETSPKQL